MPWCLDKWKKYVKEKKIIRFWLKWSNYKLKGITDLRASFDKWARLSCETKQFLRKIPFHHLKHRYYNNAKKMLDQTENLYENQFQINQMKE